ncbi:MAG: aspartate--tRNA ligase [Deltaproteobacteria bacterium]|nr:aspartate--tRNA ligase [Deltaproteobacteria bacterium]
MDRINNWQRTHNCGSLGKDNVGEEVTLMGWVNRRRDLGKLIFIDLRDRYGLTQVVFDEEFDKKSHDKAAVLRNEWVIAVRGLVKPRLPGQENRELPTGEIEVNISELKILNETKVPPFQVDGKVDASENLRLKYRYLDLRRPSLFKNLNMRHKIALNIRQYLSGEGFLEVETPMLTKSTPEGARDYLVPSRISKGYFYALPQSPQLFKQLLMIAGFDRYFQIVRCFRDEDLRADRQPEFTQVDLELSFANEDMVMGVFEGMISDIFYNILDIKVSSPFPRIEYIEAMNRFGSDKPDTRFGMELKDLSDIFRQSDFKVFKSTIDEGGVVKAINIQDGASFSRKELDNLNQMVIEFGVKGLFWAKINPEDWQSSIAKTLTPENKKSIEVRLEAKQGDLILFIADKLPKVNNALGLLRVELGKRRGLAKEGEYSFLWVTRFPLLEYDNEEKRFVAVHHPFTAPLEEDEALLIEKPGEIRARSYDLVLNGEEIGGGSVRIHNIDLQNKIFDKLGLKREEANEKFGFFLEALTYGAPPHAGIALGFDRLVAIMTGADSLREVIAFPKTQRATCPVTDAPSKIDKGQLEEVGLSVIFS